MKRLILLLAALLTAFPALRAQISQATVINVSATPTACAPLNLYVGTGAVAGSMWFWSGTGTGCTLVSSGGGGGTVTSFSAGNLSPLFTTSVATPTTTPALSFTISNAAAFTLFSNNTNASAAPSFTTMDSIFGSCSTGTSALTYNTTTHAFGCNTVTGGGSVSGTTNNIAKFTSSTAVGNANPTDNGTTFSLTEPVNINQTGIEETYTNATTTGTTAGLLAQFTGAPSTVVTASTSSKAVIGVCSTGCGTTGSAQIGIMGQFSCTFDGATTAGDIVIPSTTLAGQCHDSGVTTSPAGSQSVGVIRSTNAGAGSYVVDFNTPDLTAPGTSAGGGVTTNGLTSGVIPEATGTSSIGNSSPQLDIGLSSSGTLTYNGPIAAKGTVGTIIGTEGTCTGGGVGLDVECLGSSTLHLPQWSLNNSAFGGLPLNGLGGATGSNTIASGNNPQTWNWAQTTDAQNGIQIGETSASTGGTLTNSLANQANLAVVTATNSTAAPVKISQGSITNTVATPAFELQGTWNNASLLGNLIFANLTNTASNATGSHLLELQTNNIEAFGIRPNSYTTWNSGIYFTDTGQANFSSDIIGVGNINVTPGRAIRNAGSTGNLTVQSGTDGTTNPNGGVLTVKGADITGNAVSGANADQVLVRGGNNASTTATIGASGNVEIISGQGTGAATSPQGILSLGSSFLKGAANTLWDLECSTSVSRTVTDCGATPGNWVGVAEAVSTNNVVVFSSGNVPINASAAVTAGHTVCSGSTAGQVTDSGGTSLCTAAQGSTVGVVIATSSAYTLPDGVTFTASTTLPLVQLTSNGATGSGGNGTVTSIATTAPITGGTITTTGTIACPTCLTTTAGGSLTVGTPSDVTGQSTSQSAVTLATAPPAGSYNIRYYADQNAGCTTGSNSVSFTFNWTDATLARSLTTGSLTMIVTPTAASYLSGILPIYVGSGNVTYTSTVVGTCATGTSTFDIHARVTQ